MRLILKVSRLASDVFDRRTRCAVSVQLSASLHPKRRYRYVHVTCYETFILLVDLAWKLDKSLTLVQWKLDYYSNES